MTGSPDVLGPVQMDSTDLSREEPRLDFDNSANIQNGNTFGQDEMNESEAAWGFYWRREIVDSELQVI